MNKQVKSTFSIKVELLTFKITTVKIEAVDLCAARAIASQAADFKAFV